jgi:hypothetical protein
MPDQSTLLAASWMPDFLSSWTIPAAAAALTIPPLILLYFLKLRRRPQPISSTLLWKRAVEDLQVNAPFQRLRRNLLLFLQLLILILAILAIAKPVLNLPEERESTIIFLIDNSASMSTVEPSGMTRLAMAKHEAGRMVEALGRHERAMVIAFNAEARALGPFTQDKNQLLRQIDSIDPTDGLSRMSEAVALAKAHATPLGEGIGTPDNPIAPAHMVLLSDGQIEDADQIVLRQTGDTEPGLDYICVGGTADNVGIVGLDARRNYEYPEQLSVLVRVRNFGPERARTDVALNVDEQLVSVRELTLEPGQIDEPEAEGTKGEGGRAPTNVEPPAPEGSAAIIEFPLELDREGVLEVRLSRRDALAADNRAWAVVPAPKSISLLVVSPGNVFLKLAIDSLPLRESKWMTPSEYEQAPSDELIAEGRSRYDVVVFDAHSTDRLPTGNYLFLGSVPLIEGVGTAGTVEDELAIDWRDAHPVLRYIAFEHLRVIRANLLTLPREADVLIEGRHGPMLAEINRQGSRYLIQSFTLLDEKGESWNTPWLLRPGFPLYLLNAVRYLAGVGTGRDASWRRPGEAVNILAAAGRAEVTIHRPDERQDRAPVRGSGEAYYGRTDRAGLYDAEGAVSGGGRFAVSLCDDDESDIRPSKTLVLGSAPVTGESRATNVTQPLWPWLVVGVLLILTLEWIIYNKRVFV